MPRAHLRNLLPRGSFCRPCSRWLLNIIVDERRGELVLDLPLLGRVQAILIRAVDYTRYAARN